MRLHNLVHSQSTCVVGLRTEEKENMTIIIQKQNSNTMNNHNKSNGVIDICFLLTYFLPHKKNQLLRLVKNLGGGGG